MNTLTTNSLVSPAEVKDITIRTIKQMKEYLAEEERKKEEATANNSIYVPAESPFFFAVRIRSANKASPDIISALKTLRLHRINTGTFVVNNKSSKSTLHLVRSYIAFGTLSLECIRNLLYTRGFCRHNGQRKNITSKTLMARFGGEINTVEEIVSALFLGRTNASAINKWLWPFHLNSPRKGFGGRKIKDFAEGGSTGDHGRYLTDLIQRML
ncbi:large subunit ribosomal protein L7e [Nematocida homosporus]|uniref:large subunit ribosomal protein L7e n=1 Tax=Nematocida homosporus TaxID=1912981 RepID=UPI00221EE176|nr:large subunit ribosomal protein L7e [Nematocida homosporus]KAI5185418.1 large subunit ribosomal protein L7e [Nematocida homosporus]